MPSIPELNQKNKLAYDQDFGRGDRTGKVEKLGLLLYDRWHMNKFSWLIGGLVLCLPAILQGAEPSVIQIASRQQAELSRTTGQVVSSQLLGMDVGFQIHWVPEFRSEVSHQTLWAKRIARAQGALVVFWCDFAVPGEVSVHILDPALDRVDVRVLDQSKVGRYGQHEAIASMVRGIVDVKLAVDEDPLRREREEKVMVAQPSTSPALKTVVAAPAIVGGLNLGYSLRGVSSQLPGQHAGEVQARIWFWEHWSAFMGYAYSNSLETLRYETRLSFRRHGLRLGGSRGWTWGRFSLDLQAALALDLLARKSSVESPDLELLADAGDLALGGDVSLLLGYQIGSRLWIQTGPGVALWARNVQYELGTEEQNISLLSPWWVHPFWELELSVRFY